ncbi:MAG: S1/P1 nuclease [Gammaproteobacteria bacterium]|nr:S1/P1 nuclease [Gammaproteobacteria bacterium]
MSNNYLFAWNYQGHKLISEIAYDNLTTKQQQKLDNILDALIYKLPQEDKKIYKQQQYSLSKLAKLSIMPDFWKEETLNSLADNFHIKSITIAQSIGNLKTSDWHYSSKIFSSDNKFHQEKQGKQEKNGKLDVILPQLITSTKSTVNPAEKALGIIYLAHLMEDSHQPLHAMSRKTNQTNNDRGGNYFCLKRNNKRLTNCRANLHSYWDSAGTLLNTKKPITLLTQDIIKSYPTSAFINQIKILDPEIWLQESFSYKTVVYDTPEYEYPNKIYQAKTRTITSQRMALAGYRLSKLLAEIII